jgi:hypothetical protein
MTERVADGSPSIAILSTVLSIGTDSPVSSSFLSGKTNFNHAQVSRDTVTKRKTHNITGTSSPASIFWSFGMEDNGVRGKHVLEGFGSSFGRSFLDDTNHVDAALKE